MTDFCDCKSHQLDGYAPIFPGSPVFVAPCGRPSIGVWDGNNKMCYECGGTFSSPWEEFCERCIRIFPHERPLTEPWRGWKWARDLALTLPVGHLGTGDVTTETVDAMNETLDRVLRSVV